MKIAISTSKNQWFVNYAEELAKKIKAKLFFNHKDIDNSFDIVFILSYHQIIEKEYLEKHKHNIVIHESALPKGKGWAPMFWQILEGKNQIPFTMFEASNGVDNGDIYMQKTLELNGNELNSELREKQANFTIQMCLEFLENYEEFKVHAPQTGEESFYQKRTPKDSELDIHKSINEQFNLLRIVDNEDYPAFFYKNGKKYILKIEEEK
jgi:methionyl-tRNA formyltransferase